MVDSVDIVKALQEKNLAMQVPGALLTAKGPQDYIGCVPAITGTLFFNGAHTKEVRETICACFDEYEKLAKEHLTWVWRSEPPVGPDKYPYKKAPPLRAMVDALDEDDLVSFAFTSGAEAYDAGPWEFQVYGMRGWEATMRTRGTSSLRFSLPLSYVEESPLAFQSIFVSFARRLKAIHGYGGHGLVLSVARTTDNQPFEAYIAEKLNGLDVGGPVSGAANAHKGIKTVSWLTAVNYEMVEKIGGIGTIRSELPRNWFAIYDYGAGVVIQAGPSPEGAPVDADPMPARYVLPNQLFKELRTEEAILHYATTGTEPRILGKAVQEWLRRFDIEESKLQEYKTKLLKEPQLTKGTSLPERL